MAGDQAHGRQGFGQMAAPRDVHGDRRHPAGGSSSGASPRRALRGRGESPGTDVTGVRMMAPSDRRSRSRSTTPSMGTARTSVQPRTAKPLGQQDVVVKLPPPTTSRHGTVTYATTYLSPGIVKRAGHPPAALRALQPRLDRSRPPRAEPTEMIVDQPHRLDERIHRGRADQPPAAAFESLASAFDSAVRGQRHERRRSIGALARRGGSNHHTYGERALGPHQLDRPSGVVDHRLDLAAMPHDPGVARRRLRRVAEARDLW